MNAKILFVDDDPNALAAHERTLRKQFVLETASGGLPALALLERSGPFAVIVADMQMPGMNGIQLLTQVESRWPETARIMLTGHTDERTAKAAVNQGHIFRFLTKPCSTEELAQTVSAGVRQYQLVTAERDLLEKTLTGTIKLLTEVLANVDPLTFGVGQRLREHSRRFLQGYAFPQPWQLETAAALSGIGSVTLPPALRKKSRSGVALTGEEKDLLARLPEMGALLLQNIPRLEPVAQIIRYQNKNFDGSGIPTDSLAGETLPLGARILRVLGALVELEERGQTRTEAADMLRAQEGAYDPRLLGLVLASYLASPVPQFEVVRRERAMALEDLRVGHVLCYDAETLEGVPLVAGGTALTPMMLQTFRNFARLGSLKQPIRVWE